MSPTKRQARIAGLWYMLLGVTAPIGLVYVPGKVIVPGSPAATIEHLRAYGSLVRIGIASELFHQVIGVFLVLALYRLFKEVNQKYAVLMVIFSLLGLPIIFLNVLNEIAALVLVSGADYLSVFDQRQLDALAYMFVRLHSQGITVASIFWGLWLFPFGILVIRSGFIPRFLGVLLFIAGSAYIVTSTTSVLVPQYLARVNSVAMILYAAELPIMFWLLIWGAKTRASGALGS